MNEKRTDTYYCDRHEEVMQIAQAPGTSPRCPVCGAVMTFGRYSESEPVRTLEEACAYLLWMDGPHSWNGSSHTQSGLGWTITSPTAARRSIARNSATIALL